MDIKERRRGTAIVETEKGILVVAQKDIYITPGGGADKGESRMQASIRELKEETGLEPYFAMRLFNFEGKVHTKYNYKDLHSVYLIKAKGIPKPKQEIKKIGYYVPNSDINISHTTKEIISKYYEYKTKNSKLFEVLDRI